MRTAFIGLGVMGYPMAGHLQQKTQRTTVYNRNPRRAERWLAQYNGQMAATPKAAARDADLVMVCVGNDDDVRSVVYGADGVLSGMSQGNVLIDHTTSSAELAEELAAACADKGVSFLDAPVSGGEAGAKNGQLTIMCGGLEADFRRVEPVLKSYAKMVNLIGSHGQGQRCKMVNQLCIVGILYGLSEAVTLAQNCGLDMAKVVDTLKHGAAGSWQMENRALTMSRDEFNFGFAIDWMRKDLGICLAEAERRGLSLELAKKADVMYAGLQQLGLGRMDTSVLIRALDSVK